MKLKNLLPEEKVSDTIKDMYPFVYKMKLVRVPIYQTVGRNPSYKESNRTVRVGQIGGSGKQGGNTAYIVELKRAVQIHWKGKIPIILISKKAKWEIIDYKLEK